MDHEAQHCGYDHDYHGDENVEQHGCFGTRPSNGPNLEETKEPNRYEVAGPGRGVQDKDDYENRGVMQYQALVRSPGAESPSLARKAVLGRLQGVGLEDLAERPLLIASELVANEAVHAHTVLEISNVNYFPRCKTRCA